MAPGLVPFWRNSPLARWDEDADPFSMFRREMNRLFDSAFGSFGSPGFGSSGTGAMAAPKMDISETDGELRVTAELPGVHDKDVEVSLDGDLLTIRGERKEEHEQKEHNYHIRERTRGTFLRSLPLPFSADPNQVKAIFKNGVLTVTLPKPKEGEQNQRRIQVQTETASAAGSSREGDQAASGTSSTSEPAGSEDKKAMAAE
jgi:HSP20 family protein